MTAQKTISADQLKNQKGNKKPDITNVAASVEIVAQMREAGRNCTSTDKIILYHKTQEMKIEPFVIERTYNAPVEKVWKAITDKDQMKQWYFDLSAFKPEVGFEFQFDGENEGRKFVHHCKITEVVVRKKLSYSWRYEGYEGDSLVTFELFAEGTATRLKLTHEGLESFPRNNPDFAKENFVAGWTDIIGRSLKEFVEKRD